MTTAKIEQEKGYSIIELVIIMAVMAILAILGIPLFLNFADDSTYQTTKLHFTNLRKSCIYNPNSRPNTVKVNGAIIEGGNNCNSSITASMNEGKCCIRMDLSNGEKNGGDGWRRSVSNCGNACQANNIIDDDRSKDTTPSCLVCKDSEDIQVKVCAPNIHLASVKCFDLSGKKKWWCNNESGYVPGNYKNNFYSKGSCAEQLNEHACKNGFSGCIENYKDPPADEQEYTVTRH